MEKTKIQAYAILILTAGYGTLSGMGHPAVKRLVDKSVSDEMPRASQGGSGRKIHGISALTTQIFKQQDTFTQHEVLF